MWPNVSVLRGLRGAWWEWWFSFTKWVICGHPLVILGHFGDFVGETHKWPISLKKTHFTHQWPQHPLLLKKTMLWRSHMGPRHTNGRVGPKNSHFLKKKRPCQNTPQFHTNMTPYGTNHPHQSIPRPRKPPVWLSFEHFPTQLAKIVSKYPEKGQLDRKKFKSIFTKWPKFWPRPTCLWFNSYQHKLTLGGCYEVWDMYYEKRRKKFVKTCFDFES